VKRSSRLSVALHVLAHLAEHPDGPATSEALAACVGTNPVVVRRTMAGLREAGLVTSAKGHGGGWALARPAPRITLADVHAALGERLLLAIDVAGPGPDCLIEHAVAGTLGEFLDDAEALLRARLARLTLADLTARIRHGHASGHAPGHSPGHGADRVPDPAGGARPPTPAPQGVRAHAAHASGEPRDPTPRPRRSPRRRG
jgi:Rrf2 family protein